MQKRSNENALVLSGLSSANNRQFSKRPTFGRNGHLPRRDGPLDHHLLAGGARRCTSPTCRSSSRARNDPAGGRPSAGCSNQRDTISLRRAVGKKSQKDLVARTSTALSRPIAQASAPGPSRDPMVARSTTPGWPETSAAARPRKSAYVGSNSTI